MSSSLEDIQEKINSDIINSVPEKLKRPFIDAIASKKLRLQNKDITAAELIDYVIPFLNNNKNVIDLDLYLNQIGVEGARALAVNKTLTILSVCDSQIGVESARALAESLTLTSLNVSYNQIGDEGARALAENLTLTSLNADNSHIGDEGAIALAGNHTLITLDVRNNQIGKAGRNALNQSIQARHENFMQQKLTFLAVMGTKIRNDALSDNNNSGVRPLLHYYYIGVNNGGNRLDKFLLNEIVDYIKPNPLKVCF